ncbi:hypothetical protein K227x_26430 [Rubripirellula lacrimiformis]|uniref:DUF5009 domain-containing protein n=2 Tax=Rubripirellula lacrimiformis TaxID=1930273 RepID=A0A517NAU1_9BACT|nr:hypothetical protein K227x_26430 [Rubripirellula lacrimiformis]
MLWIIGGSAIAREILAGSDTDSFRGRLESQFYHVAWEGFRLYDLVFPLFLFLAGCVLPYSLAKYAETPRAVYGRLFRRGVALVLLGLLYNGILQFDFANMRYMQVLQRIGIGYVAAGLIFLHTRWRMQLVITAAILLGYWAIFAFIPPPGGVAGDYSMEGNLAGYIDRSVLPGKILEKYYGYGDNEGILSTIPAIATALLGVLAGTLLRSTLTPYRKVLSLAAAGIGCLVIGYGWGASFPVIKNLWTSSFVLVAGGWSLLLLAIFYLVIDVWQWQRAALFWVVIGSNAITIYIAQEFVDFRQIAEFFFGGVARVSGDYQKLVLLVGVLIVKWCLLFFLYRRRIFLRV